MILTEVEINIEDAFDNLSSNEQEELLFELKID